ncbi:hypothetical protein B0J14DRAFT_537549 [Halenospora varia]|nr:hypothetical protein B0J14DRAFT_537549 [Halenospora varia]
MSPPPKFASMLEASSYQTPGGGSSYAPLRENTIKTLIQMGYDKSTMIERGITWSDDHDPFGHVKNHAFLEFFTACGVRVFFSFEEHLKEKFEDFITAKGISCLVKTATLKILKPVKFPDSLIIAHRIKEMLPDRYFGITVAWSLQQQAIVAESSGYMCFFNHRTRKLVNLIEEGGAYTDLYNALVERKVREEELAARWETAHPRKEKVKL